MANQPPPLCPFLSGPVAQTAAIQVPGQPPAVVPTMVSSPCIGPRCMAWRWLEPLPEEGPTHGFCALMVSNTADLRSPDFIPLALFQRSGD